MAQSDDESIFAWRRDTADERDTEGNHEPEDADDAGAAGILALSPRDFAHSRHVRRLDKFNPRPSYRLTNKGVELTAFAPFPISIIAWLPSRWSWHVDNCGKIPNIRLPLMCEEESVDVATGTSTTHQIVLHLHAHGESRGHFSPHWYRAQPEHFTSSTVSAGPGAVTLTSGSSGEPYDVRLFLLTTSLRTSLSASSSRRQLPSTTPTLPSSWTPELPTSYALANWLMTYFLPPILLYLWQQTSLGPYIFALALLNPSARSRVAVQFLTMYLVFDAVAFLRGGEVAARRDYLLWEVLRRIHEVVMVARRAATPAAVAAAGNRGGQMPTPDRIVIGSDGKTSEFVTTVIGGMLATMTWIYSQTQAAGRGSVDAMMEEAVMGMLTEQATATASVTSATMTTGVSADNV